MNLRGWLCCGGWRSVQRCSRLHLFPIIWVLVFTLMFLPILVNWFFVKQPEQICTGVLAYLLCIGPCLACALCSKTPSNHEDEEEGAGEREHLLALDRQRLPDQVLPGQVLPGQVPPGQVPPSQVLPGQVPPGQVLPGQVLPNQGLSPQDHLLQEEDSEPRRPSPQPLPSYQNLFFGEKPPRYEDI